MQKKIVIAVVLTLVLIGCCICSGIAIFYSQEQQASFAALAAACDGRPVSGAAAYNPSSPPRIAAFKRFTSSWSYAPLETPDSLASEGVSDTSVVACLAAEPIRHVVGNCCFERTIAGVGVPGSETCYPQVRYSRMVRMYVASTGALISEREVFGETPNACNDWVRRPQQSDFEADEPTDREYLPVLTDPEAPQAPSPIPPSPSAPAADEPKPGK